MFKIVGEMQLQDQTWVQFRLRYNSQYQVIPQILVRYPAYWGYQRSLLEMHINHWKALKRILDFEVWRCQKKVNQERKKPSLSYYQYGWFSYDLADMWLEILKDLKIIDDRTIKQDLLDGTVGDYINELVYIKISPGMGLIKQHNVLQIFEQAFIQKYPYQWGLWITDGEIDGQARSLAETCNFKVIDRYDNNDFLDFIENEHIWGEIQISPYVKLVVRSIEGINNHYKCVLDIRKFSNTHRLQGWLNSGITILYEEINLLSEWIDRILESASDRDKIPIKQTNVLDKDVLYDILTEFEF